MPSYALSNLEPLEPLRRIFVPIGRGLFERHGRKLLTPRDAIASTKHDLSEPRRKRLREFELAEMLIRVQERFLDGILGDVKIAGNRVRVGKSGGRKAPNEGLECAKIAQSGAKNNRFDIDRVVFHLLT